MSEWNTGDKIDIVATKDLDDIGVGGNFHLSNDVMAVIRKLCEDIIVEWQMLLIGEVKDGEAHINDYWIPKQEVTATTVKNLELVDADVIAEKSIIATIHSHGSMPVYCSGVDDEFTNLSLIKRHMVVNNKMEFHAITVCELPTGAVTFLKAKILFQTPMASEVKDIENIQKYTYVPAYLQKDIPIGFQLLSKRKKKKLAKEHGIITELTEDDYYAIEQGWFATDYPLRGHQYP